MSRRDKRDGKKGGTDPDRLRAFEALVAAYETPLLRYAARMLSDPAAAEDIVQGAFVKLFRKWKPPPEPSARLSSWLYRVTHNAAVDLLRRQARRRRLHRRHAEEQEGRETGGAWPRQDVSEEAEKAVRELRRLSARERQLVILKVYDEMSYREISDITGLSESNVGYILHHAMRKMAAALAREGVRRG